MTIGQISLLIVCGVAGFAIVMNIMTPSKAPPPEAEATQPEDG